MNSPSSYTVDDTSEIADRVRAVIELGASIAAKGQGDRVQAAQQRIARLEERGLLRRQRFHETTRADFERHYLVGGNSQK